MSVEELDRLFRLRTEREQVLFDNIESRLIDVKSDNILPFLIEDHEFIASGDTIGVNKQDRYQEILPHFHNYIELSYLWSGSCIQRINGNDVFLEKGDICILDTEAVHSFQITGDEDLILNVLMRREYFAAAFLNRMIKQGIISNFLVNAVTRSQNKNHYLVFHSHKNAKVQMIMEQLFCEYYSRDIGSLEIIDSYLVILFTELLRTYRDYPLKEEACSCEESDVLRILQYIEKNYQSCSLTSISEFFGFHPNYLTMLLKKETGKSFIDHVHEQKLIKAKILLCNTNLPVTEVISECGYNNLNFFYHKFKNFVGCTPAEYRRTLSVK